LKHVLSRIIFLTGIVAPVANAGLVTYTINFTGGAPLPTAGSFTYDTTARNFTAFSVTWDGVDFNFLAYPLVAANYPDAVGPECGPATPSTFFELLTTGLGCTGGTPFWFASSNDEGGQYFTFNDFTVPVFPEGASYILVGMDAGIPTAPTQYASGDFTATEVPEPAPQLLTIAGGAMLLAGKRRAFRNPPATQTTHER
jgi:hypothetical protein